MYNNLGVPHNWERARGTIFPFHALYKCSECGHQISSSSAPDPYMRRQVLMPGKYYWVELDCAEYAMWKVNET